VLVDIDGNVLYNIDLGTIRFDEQRLVLSELLDRGIVRKMYIDESGLGMDLVEHMYSRYSERVVGVSFTAQEKHSLVRNFSRAIGMGRIRIYPLKDLLKQILDIRVEFTNNGNIIYRVSNNRHNGDKFWALCLALRGLPGLEFSYSAESDYYSLPSYRAYGTRIDYMRHLRKGFRFSY
jgi:phage FluMu gp28-like protein